MVIGSQTRSPELISTRPALDLRLRGVASYDQAREEEDLFLENNPPPVILSGGGNSQREFRPKSKDPMYIGSSTDVLGNFHHGTDCRIHCENAWKVYIREAAVQRSFDGIGSFASASNSAQDDRLLPYRSRPILSIGQYPNTALP